MLADILICLVLIAIVTSIVHSLIKNKKQGKSLCSGACTGSCAHRFSWAAESKCFALRRDLLLTVVPKSVGVTLAVARNRACRRAAARAAPTNAMHDDALRCTRRPEVRPPYIPSIELRRAG